MRERKFDIAKAIGIYMVVYDHFYPMVGGQLVPFIRFCNMPIFFFISGHFLEGSMKNHDFKTLLLRKTKSLLIPYFFWSFISLCFNLLMMFINRELNGLNDVLKECINIFIYSRSVWFLISLYIGSIWFCLLKKITEKHTNIYHALWIVSWVVFSVIIPGKYFKFYKIKWLFPFMIFGGLWAQKKTKKTKHTIWGFIIMALFIFLSFFTYKEPLFSIYGSFEYKSIKDVLAGFLYYCISFMGIYSIIFLADTLKGKLADFLNYVGKYSIDIYVLHMFLIKIHFWHVPFSRILLCFYSFIGSAIIICSILLIHKILLKRFTIYKIITGKV